MRVPEILVPYESKKVSEEAFTEALRLARGRKVTISVIKFQKHGNSDWNFTPLSYMAGEGVNVLEEWEFEDEMEELHKKAIKEKIPFYSEIIIASNPAKGIMDYVKKHNVHQIIMKSRGRKGLTKTLLGSVSEKVTKKNPPCKIIVLD